MAIAATTVWQIQSTATSGNVNGGGFNPANANMPTDLTTDSNTGNTNSPVVSSASYNFVANDVGHWVYIQSGTNWNPGWYQIASVASNKATLSAAVGQAIQVTNNLYGTNTVAGASTVGTPTGGVWAIDYSQSNAAAFAGTDLASTNGTTNPSDVTSATNPFGPQMVGNIIFVSAGTNWTVQRAEIVSVAAAVATLDKAAGSSATLSAGTYKTGGAFSLGSSDDAIFELATASASAANRYFVKGGVTYTIGGTVSISAAGNSAQQITIEGYNSTRGDRPTGSTRPTFACGAVAFTTPANWRVLSMIYTGTGTSVLSVGASNTVVDTAVFNSSTTAARVSITPSSGTLLHRVEAVSYRGNAISSSTNIVTLQGCYIHDSNIGFLTTTGATIVTNCIIACCISNAISYTSTNSGIRACVGNTLYGAENKLGVGLSYATGATVCTVLNNIIYGFATGVSHADAQSIGYDDYNDYYNNTNDISSSTQWYKGVHDQSLNPVFTNVAQRTGSTATTTSGNHLVQSGATFQTWGVTPGRDYLYVISGTGVTAGIYGIISVDSETQITTDITLTANATADKVWSITTGRNFNIGTNLKALGYPGQFPVAATTGYLDIGGVQRQESGSGGTGGSYSFC